MSTAVVTPSTPAAASNAPHVTFWDKVKTLDHSFLAWWEKEYAKFQKEEPKIQQGLDTLTKYAVPALNIALAAAGGPAAIGTEAATVIADAQSALSVGSSLVQDFGPTPTAASVYNGISQNLQSILTLDGVKNPQTQNAITKVVGLVGSAAEGISAAAAATPPAAAPAPASA